MIERARARANRKNLPIVSRKNLRPKLASGGFFAQVRALQFCQKSIINSLAVLLASKQTNKQNHHIDRWKLCCSHCVRVCVCADAFTLIMILAHIPDALLCVASVSRLRAPLAIERPIQLFASSER